MRFLVSELRPARPGLLRWHDALWLRSAIAGWRRAVADDDEDVDVLAILVEAAGQLAERVVHADLTGLDELAVCGYVSDRDGARVVEIDTTEVTGRVRVFINGGVIYDGDPNIDELPGEYCDECGAQTGELVSREHEASCSLYPSTGVRSARRPGRTDDVADRIDPTKARYETG